MAGLASATTAADLPMTVDRAAQARLLEAPGQRLRQGLGPDRSPGPGPRCERDEVASGPEPCAPNRLGCRLVRQPGGKELLQGGVVQAAARRPLVAQADAVDRGRRGQTLHHDLVDRTPRDRSPTHPAGADAPAGVIDARRDHLRIPDGDDPGLPAAEPRRGQRRDYGSVLARRVHRRGWLPGQAHAQPPVEGVEDAGTPVDQGHGGIHELLERGPVGDELIEHVDDGQPLGHLATGPSLLPDDRSHVALGADSRP